MKGKFGFSMGDCFYLRRLPIYILLDLSTAEYSNETCSVLGQFSNPWVYKGRESTIICDYVEGQCCKYFQAMFFVTG